MNLKKEGTPVEWGGADSCEELWYFDTAFQV